MSLTTQLGWTLGPDEFGHVWDQLGIEAFPYPLQVARSGLTGREQAVVTDRVRARLRANGVLGRGDKLDPDLETCLRMLHAPEVSVDSVWMAEDGSDSPHRVLAARVGRRAVVATQEPGPSEHVGGDVLVRDGDVTASMSAGIAAGGSAATAALAAAVVAELPADRAGRREGGSWRAEHADRVPVLTELLCARRLRAGQLGVTAAGGRGPSLFWFDVAGDGRYALLRTVRADGRQWVNLTPADSTVLRDELANALSGNTASAPPRRQDRL
ncbi:ESX secretion-associated protein EspG [Actinokineospora auranticolor]|uniref:ESAT-6 protein secretion system EspG family protein n=1 Tax=Actinokineospora auranticolor TaxID=155976 RepID=A0A2S6GYU1_9PSEU|nr:ESX secretion-associated protein EspG [Actinokineospora auranticolor]PPK70330.1 ESAT-6 protein secretion system EspG family protein [Actinokineospora auranticolor]